MAPVSGRNTLASLWSEGTLQGQEEGTRELLRVFSAVSFLFDWHQRFAVNILYLFHVHLIRLSLTELAIIDICSAAQARDGGGNMHFESAAANRAQHARSAPTDVGQSSSMIGTHTARPQFRPTHMRNSSHAVGLFGSRLLYLSYAHVSPALGRTDFLSGMAGDSQDAYIFSVLILFDRSGEGEEQHPACAFQ